MYVCVCASLCIRAARFIKCPLFFFIPNFNTFALCVVLTRGLYFFIFFLIYFNALVSPTIPACFKPCVFDEPPLNAKVKQSAR